MRRCKTDWPLDTPNAFAALKRRLRLVFTEAPEAGNAVVEFLGLALVLLIPVIYVVITLAALQAGVYASASAADQAAKVYLQQKAGAAGASAANLAAASTLADFGIPTDRGHVGIVCSDGACAAPGSLATVTVQVQVPLPLLPTLFGHQLSVATVQSTSVQAVSDDQ